MVTSDKGGKRASAATGSRRPAVRAPLSAGAHKRGSPADSDLGKAPIAKPAAGKPSNSLVSVMAERDRLKQALKVAQARLARLEARESVVQDHLTRAIATIDRLLVGN